jgi:pSer/pThr/pTyr-binding forkhead associated (FHA) protein
MAPYCPHCGAPVGDDDVRCSDCGTELDPHRTIPPPGPIGQASVKPAKPAREAVRDSERLDQDTAARAGPRPSTVRKRRPASAAPPPAIPPPPNPAIPPPPNPAYYPPPPPPVGPPPAHPAPSPGGVRGFLIRMLGGQPEPPAPPPAPLSGAYPSYAPYPVNPQPSLPSQAAPPQPMAMGSWPQFGSPAQAPPPRTAEPSRPHLGDDEQEDGKTQALAGVDISKLKIPKAQYSLQILDASGQWRDWGPIQVNGLKVGRSPTSVDFPGLATMAERHFKLSYDHSKLVVEDLGALNGIYLKVTQPIELFEGMRFRVGGHVFEFHRAEPFEPEPPKRSEDGEEFYAFDLEPVAFLDAIRPSSRPGARFPIVRRETTILGTARKPDVQIALHGDHWVSGHHAQIRFDGERFLLEDLNSRNGTFVQVLGSQVVNSGDVILAGRVLFRVVNRAGGGP